MIVIIQWKIIEFIMVSSMNTDKQNVLIYYICNQPGNDVRTLVGLHRGTRTHLDVEWNNMCFSFERGGGVFN